MGEYAAHHGAPLASSGLSCTSSPVNVEVRAALANLGQRPGGDHLEFPQKGRCWKSRGHPSTRTNPSWQTSLPCQVALPQQLWCRSGQSLRCQRQCQRPHPRTGASQRWIRPCISASAALWQRPCALQWRSLRHRHRFDRAAFPSTPSACSANPGGCHRYFGKPRLCIPMSRRLRLRLPRQMDQAALLAAPRLQRWRTLAPRATPVRLNRFDLRLASSVPSGLPSFCDRGYARRCLPASRR